jgi:hypothetical protein
MVRMTGAVPTVELWVDDHQEYEPGIVTAHLRNARIPLDPRPGDNLVVGDDELPPASALIVSREPDDSLRLHILPGRPEPRRVPHSPHADAYMRHSLAMLRTPQ